MQNDQNQQNGCRYICKRLTNAPRLTRAALFALPPIVYTALPEGSKSDFFFPGTAASFYAAIIALENLAALRKTSNILIDGLTKIALVLGYLALFSKDIDTGYSLIAAALMMNSFFWDRQLPNNRVSNSELLLSFLVGFGGVISFLYTNNIIENDKLFNQINQNQQCLPGHNPMGFIQQLKCYDHEQWETEQFENSDGTFNQHTF